MTKISAYFYPRPPRGGRPEIDSYLEETKLISIHALREEGDVHGLEKALSQKISIHALREEGDAIHRNHDEDLRLFLSTPSARRATYNPNKVSEENLFLSTPSARRATRWLSWRAPRWWYFYPRPPRGGRRRLGPSRSRRAPISIHALREEGDRYSSTRRCS